MRRLLLAALAAALVAPVSAHAADPILPLAQVQPGMHCTGFSVVRGLEISSFGVEVVDVIDRPRGAAARILVRVSGPAVDATGVGPGFSGSPILCSGADGIARNIGAISETIGEYGGRTALATPIESIIAQPTLPAAGSRSLIGARSLAGPLTIAGLRPSLGRAFARAASRAGRTLIASPAATRATFAPQPLVPGAAVAVGLSSGDIALGALGTVAYADGPHVWIFGHELDAAGRRSLFLQDAFVHTVVSNPLASQEMSTYKLGAPGNDLGTITSDGPHAVAGVLGAPPPSATLRITTRDLDSGQRRSSLTRIADEGDIGLPTGGSPLSIAAAAAAAEAAAGTLAGGAPARQSGDMCMKFTLRELRAPLRLCHAYAVDGPTQNALAGLVAADIGQAVGVIESYRFGTLHPVSLEIGIRVRRGLRQAYLVGARVPRVVRRGSTIAVRLQLRRTGTGARSTRTVRLRVPADAPSGLRTLRIRGTSADTGSDPSQGGGDDLSVVFEDEENGADDGGPRSVREVRDRFENLAREDGVTARLGGEDRSLLRDPRLRISGEARVQLRVR
ncbi:MAG: hypothetical protein Q8O56_01330 [Solirubrobacteraceae bacterium]|nr:hypothetical protein [Solirubrobacteraceae bacterium]